MKPLALLALSSFALTAQQYPPIGPDNSPETQEILRRINNLGPNDIPDLRLKREQNYAKTSTDVEPFGGVKPYKEHFLLQMEYTGPGRSEPEPGPELKKVSIGFIGPIMPTVSVATGGKSHEEALGKKMLQGAQLAIEQANTRGGYVKRKIPFELDIVNDNGLWGSTGNEVITMAYKRPVWAILGTIDSANSHIAIRVALKSKVYMMNSGDTEPTFIETKIPWTGRCIGDDRQQGYLLSFMIRKTGYKRIGIIRASIATAALASANQDSARRQPPRRHRNGLQGRRRRLRPPVQRLREANVDAIVTGATPRIRRLNIRKLGMKQPLHLRPQRVERVHRSRRRQRGGRHLRPPGTPHRGSHLAQFVNSKPHDEPDTYAAHGYDGMNMLLWATNNAGLNRAKIRDLIATRSTPWPGVTGDIPLSSAMDDMGDVFLARFDKDRWTYHSREELQIPRGYIPTRERVSRGLETASTIK